MPMYNLIGYNNNYSKTWRSFWQYYKNNRNDDTVNSESFKFRINIIETFPAAGITNNVKFLCNDSVATRHISKSR